MSLGNNCACKRSQGYLSFIMASSVMSIRQPALYYYKLPTLSINHPELSGGITILTEVANVCAAMDTLIDQDGYEYKSK